MLNKFSGRPNTPVRIHSPRVQEANGKRVIDRRTGRPVLDSTASVVQTHAVKIDGMASEMFKFDREVSMNKTIFEFRRGTHITEDSQIEELQYPDDNIFYDVKGITEIGRNIGIRVFAERGS